MRAERALQASREELREIAAISASAREAEQRRIARELHDELAQTLATLKNDLEWLIDRVPQDDAQLARKIAAMHALARGAVAATRRIASDLRPLMLDDLGFAAAMQWLVEDFRHRHGIECTLHVEPPELQLDEPTRRRCFASRRKLANVARHAAASHATVELVHASNAIELTIRDDGARVRSRRAAQVGIVRAGRVTRARVSRRRHAADRDDARRRDDGRGGDSAGACAVTVAHGGIGAPRGRDSVKAVVRAGAAMMPAAGRSVVVVFTLMTDSEDRDLFRTFDLEQRT